MITYQVKNLKQHCFDLAYYFFNLNQIKTDKFSSQNYSYWLHLASSVEQIQLDLGNIGFGREGLIDLSQPLYHEAGLKNAQIVKSLVIFNLIWHTFENLKSDQFSEGENDSLKNLSEFLDDNYHPFKNLIYYNNIVSELKRLIRQSQILDPRSILHHVTQEQRSSVGISIVNRIKSYFAHCAYQFPLGSDPTGQMAIDPEVIDLSSRIVLLTMQMVMVPYFEQNSHLTIKCWWYSEESKRKMPIHSFLRTVHLRHT